jgi:crotonobetainyl-CoA:carnitine CoA-transferase CaiB-like acyl-CoA transferase
MGDQDALSGVRVIDFTRAMAGPYATQFLADFGADVIKVEGLPEGDTTRSAGVDFIGDDSSLFLNWNHGKRSLALDLRKPEGLAVALRLAASADVLVENYRPGVADSIGIGYEVVSKLNPRLVYCSVSAFGQTGPWSHRPGTDPVVQAMSGVMYVTGEPDRTALRPGVPFADFTGAMACVQGVLLALMARERTGAGQRVDISMLHTMLLSLSTRVATYWATGKEPQRLGNSHSVAIPYDCYETADGQAVAGVWGSKKVSWQLFCEAVGREDLADDPRFRDNASRVRNKVDLTEILQAEFLKCTTDEWDRRFDKVGALFAPVLSISQALEHPQIATLPPMIEVEHPVYGSLTVPCPAGVNMHKTPGQVRLPPPMLGQHTVEILAEAGLTQAESDSLLASGAAEQWEHPGASIPLRNSQDA